MYLINKKQSSSAGAISLTRGFTLIELMLAMLIMLIVTISTVQIAANVFQTNTQSIHMVQLSQEMRSVIQLISRDMRRSGYKNDALAGFLSTEAINSGVTMGSLDDNNTADCLQVGYEDSNGDTKNVVYRLRVISDVGRVSAHFDSGATCNTSTDNIGWVDVSDPLLAHISALEFVLSRQLTDIVTNVSTGNVIKVGLDQINIVISATLRTNEAVNRSITNRVQLRNQNLSV